jgi:hypothetical protein
MRVNTILYCTFFSIDVISEESILQHDNEDDVSFPSIV